MSWGGRHLRWGRWEPMNKARELQSRDSGVGGRAGSGVSRKRAFAGQGGTLSNGCASAKRGRQGTKKMSMVLAAVFALMTLVRPVVGMCANRCSGHGDCNHYNKCECWSGWEGGDCSERSCPTGLAWSDQASGVDEAHAPATCSNRGQCDLKKGRCKCMEGFTGSACERSMCPNRCSDHGKCLALTDYAADYRDSDAEQYSYDDVWDGEKLHRCACDSGYTGYDCSLKECPTGDDPLTTGQANEVQVVVCGATSGTWVLYFEDKVSDTMAYDVSAEDLKASLEAISIVPSVAVNYSLPGSGACNATAINVITVEFEQNFGSLQSMWAFTSSLSGGSLDPPVQVTADGSTVYDSDNEGYASVKGTKENEYCSNRGLCDFRTGSCECYDSNTDIFGSSDGLGGPGTRGDCGYAVTETGGCPGEVACSGHGTCDESTFACECVDGWLTGDCSQRPCPAGLSWFSYPTEDEKSHDVRVECSDGGLCNPNTGVCECDSLFYGAACEYMVCPRSDGPSSPVCSDHGRCMTMAELALFSEDNGDLAQATYGTDPNNAYTWDAHRIHGCLCDDGYTGPACTEKVCPTGDDPATFDDSAETQLLSCAATNGTFTLTFRQQETAPIAANATSAELEEALEDLTSIDVVVVDYHNGSLCESSAAVSPAVVSVTFLTEHSDVPDLTADSSLLVDDANGGLAGSGNVTFAFDNATLEGYTSVMGTTEEEPCSNRGVCNRRTGECECFANWGSSNGYGELGSKKDCGYRIPVSANLRGAPSGPGHYSQIYENMDKVAANKAYKDMARVAIANKLALLANK